MPALAKITAPSPAGILPRQRLFTLLDDHRSTPVTWIAGPAGSGKTSLVSSYLKSCKAHSLWYKTDEGDMDIASFFYYLSEAARKSAPRQKKTLPLLSPEYLMDIPTFTRRFFELFYSKMKSGSFLIIDNYQEIPMEAVLHPVLNDALLVIPEGIRVIIISRQRPLSQFSRLHAHEQMSVLSWKDLRLSLEESTEIALARLPKLLLQDLPDLVHKLHRTAGGWAAGLVLLIESSKLKDIDYRSVGGLTPDEIFEYFATEIFQKADGETQTFLLKTAFLPAMTARTAAALTNMQTAAQLLSGLNRINFFIEKHRETEPVFNYHPLFREFLMSRAKETFSCDEILEIQLLAASVLMESGQVEDAAALLLDSRNWKEFIPFVLKHAPSLMAQGRCKIIEEWLEAIPKEIAEAAPWLLYWLGVCKLGSFPAESRSFFERAFHLFESLGDETGVLLAWAGAVDTFFLEFADFRPIDSWINWLDARMRQGFSFPSAEVEARVAASMTGALVWRMPDHPDMKKWVNVSMSLSGKHQNADARLRAYMDIALYHIWMGDLTECGTVVDEIRAITCSRSASPLMMISSKVAEGLFYLASANGGRQAVKLTSMALRRTSRK
jgi:LuxR family transcriptional regulator, maltose regulon positive regulatory protein